MKPEAPLGWPEIHTLSGLNDELQWRGMVSDATEGLKELFASERVTAYIGFDPTASSLHVGNLLEAR